MPKTRARGGSTAATVIKVILLILAVIVILAAAVFGAYYLSNGFGGQYPTFATSINGDLILKSGSVKLPRGSEIKVLSFSDYSFKVVAAEPEQDFTLAVSGETLNYSELAGEDMTAGFSFTEQDGTITVDYGSAGEILSAALGADVAAHEEGQPLFTLIITSGKSELSLDFVLATRIIDVTGITIVPDGDIIL